MLSINGNPNTPPALTSGIVTSGNLGDASVLSGTIGSGQISSGKLCSGFIAALEQNASLNSGQVGSGFIASGSVDGFFGPSRRIQSGTIGVSDLGSGAVVAGTVGSGAIQSGNVASGSIGGNHIASGAIQSGDIASGAVVGAAGAGRSIASGTVGPNDLGSGAVTSGAIASGQIGANHLASGAVTSGAIASGQVGTNHFGSGVVLSGTIASGQLGQNHHASGLFNPVLADWFVCDETISGLKAVSIDCSGFGGIVRSERQSGLRLPAIGVTLSGAVSGTAALVVMMGPIVAGVSGMIASGFTGGNLYVGSGGLIVNQSGFMGGTSSGAPTLSGSLVQRIGVSISGGIFVLPGQAASGLLSGLLGQL